MAWHTWIAYVSIVVVVIVTPGPAAALCMTHASKNGSLRTLFTIAGLLLSSLTLISVSSLGLGAALAASGTLFTIIKFAGAAYLVYLGIKIWRAPPSAREGQVIAVNSAPARPIDLMRTWQQTEITL